VFDVLFILFFVIGVQFLAGARDFHTSPFQHLMELFPWV